MARWVVRLAAVLFAAVAVGMVITWVVRGRAAQDRVYCANHLRELYVATFPGLDPLDPTPDVVPAGTLPGPFPVDRRLSWVAGVLPGLNQKGQDLAPIVAMIARELPNDVGGNATAGQARVSRLICPASAVAIPTDRPGMTMYVGIGGVGPDAAELPPGSPRAGAFRYDAPTPLAAFADGLSTTILFAETSQPDRWIAGGRPTVRTIDDGANFFQGRDSLFGGNHLDGANFGTADGGVRFLSPHTSPRVLRALTTVAGGPDELID